MLSRLVYGLRSCVHLGHLRPPCAAGSAVRCSLFAVRSSRPHALTCMDFLAAVVHRSLVVTVLLLQVTPRVVNKVPQDKTLDENELQHGDIILFQIRPPKARSLGLFAVVSCLVLSSAVALIACRFCCCPVSCLPVDRWVDRWWVLSCGIYPCVLTSSLSCFAPSYRALWCSAHP